MRLMQIESYSSPFKIVDYIVLGDGTVLVLRFGYEVKVIHAYLSQGSPSYS